jgi:hypothetical protein
MFFFLILSLLTSRFFYLILIVHLVLISINFYLFFMFISILLVSTSTSVPCLYLLFLQEEIKGSSSYVVTHYFLTRVQNHSDIKHLDIIVYNNKASFL